MIGNIQMEPHESDDLLRAACLERTASVRMGVRNQDTVVDWAASHVRGCLLMYVAEPSYQVAVRQLQVDEAQEEVVVPEIEVERAKSETAHHLSIHTDGAS